MRPVLARLRWQLTLSHLIAVAFTLMCMIAAAIVLGATWFGGATSRAREPAQDARGVATAVAGLVEHDQTSQLNVVLQAFADGSLRAVPPFGGPADRGPAAFGLALRDVAYIVVLDPSGQPIASSDTAGAAFAPPERNEWSGLSDAGAAALVDGSDAAVVVRSGPGPAAFGIALVTGSVGRPLGTMIVAKMVLPPPSSGLNVLNVLAIFGAATMAVLAAASVFALASSSLVAYLLSRRLVARLERLSGAAQALRAGDLAARVPVQGQDEVAHLQASFNAMATDLEHTLHDLEGERDRVAGLLDARRQLVASVSHELRTPVAIVRGYLESARRRGGLVESDLQADLETMERELERLQILIDDLFTLSRAEVGRLELRLGPVDVGAVAKGIVETVAPLAWRQGRVEIVAKIDPDLPPAQADADRLAQIISNLLSNATRHTAPGGLVAVSTVAEPAWIKIEVRDTGEGIAAEDSPHIFDRFYTRTQGGSARHDGAGLGLALVKELSAGMHGSVEVASEAGEGSVFTVRLPLAQPKTDTAIIPAALDALDSARPRTSGSVL